MTHRFYVTSGEPRKTHGFDTFADALHFAIRRYRHGDLPVRLLEDVNWIRCLTPDDRESLGLTATVSA